VLPGPDTVDGLKLLVVKRSPPVCVRLIDELPEEVKLKPLAPGETGVVVPACAANAVKTKLPTTAKIVFVLNVFFIVFPPFPP
jgi:hypothetical protein